jgi:hypothetical protein
VSLLILVGGTLLKPAKQTAQATVSEAERLRLQRLTQRRTLEDIGSYFSALAAERAGFLIWHEGSGATGIHWGQGWILAPTRMAEGSAAPVTRILVNPNNRDFPPPLDAAAAHGGEWVLAVWRTPSGARQSAFGTMAGTRMMTCGTQSYDTIHTTIALDSRMAGAGLFTVDGSMIGMVAPCGGRLQILSIGAIESALSFSASPAGAAFQQSGFLPWESETAKKHFGNREATLVGEIWDGSPAARLGVLPGDWIAPDLFAAGASPTQVQVVRNGRPLTLQAPDLRLAESPGLLVEDVRPGGPLAEAGIVAGDRILLLDYRPVGADELSRRVAATRAQPLFLIVAGEGRKRGVLVP